MLGQLNGPGLREQLHQWVDRLFAVMPDVSGQAMNRFLLDQINEITAILEQPMRNGRRDVLAYRAFRAAVTMRQFIGEGLDEAPWASADFDIKAIRSQLLHQIITEMDDEVISDVVAFMQTFQGEYGPLLNAVLNFGVSANVEVSTSGGSEGMPDPVPSFHDEARAVSHPDPGVVWGMDFGTNIRGGSF